MIAYAAITDSADRRWTLRLLDRLTAPDLPAEDQDDLIVALEAVSDWRAIPILERLLVDSLQQIAVREAASRILRCMQYITPEWPEATLRGWWTGGDQVLRRHALLSMDAAACPDIVRAVAVDSADPLRTVALGRMVFHFNTPADLQLKMAALADPDPAVRATVARILFMDEPVAAEGLLIAAAADEVEDVAVEALDTLQYYPLMRVIRSMHDLLDSPSARIREVVRTSLDYICGRCLSAVTDREPEVSAHIRQWLGPVWDLLAFTPEELSPPPAEPSTPRAAKTVSPPPLPEMLDLLNDPNTSPKVLSEVLWGSGLLWGSGWEQYPPADTIQLRKALLNHPDPLIRERAAVPLQAWADAAGLLELAADPDFGVRKSAMYALGLLPADPHIAGIAWECLNRPGMYGVHATETLHTYVAHAAPVDSIPKLASIAADPGRPENLRSSAVHDLARLGAHTEIVGLATLLTESPAVTWGLHVAIVDAMADMSLPVPEVKYLWEVDNLDVQAAVGRVAATR